VPPRDDKKPRLPAAKQRGRAPQADCFCFSRTPLRLYVAGNNLSSFLAIKSFRQLGAVVIDLYISRTWRDATTWWLRPR
jgi:hypothetical protein